MLPENRLLSITSPQSATSVDVSQSTIDWLAKSYAIEAADPDAVAVVLSAFVSDAILEIGP